MNKKIILIISIATIIVVFFAIIIFLTVDTGSENSNEEENILEEGPDEVFAITEEEENNIVNENYPEKMTGVITIFEKSGASITTDNGKKYILSPTEPRVIYESFKIKNGDRVELRARMLEDNYIRWTRLKKI